jgi:hypothetical protein
MHYIAAIFAAISGLAELAGGLVIKGYRYIRAVKDCDKDMQRLISETTALGGLIDEGARSPTGIWIQS